MGILTESNRAQLLRYKYKSTCDSPVYNHVLSHVAQFFVDLMPTWLAPNVITLLGLVPMTVTATIAMFYDPHLEGNPLPWYPLLCAASLFIYQTMDNMDGKQVSSS